MIQVTQLSPTEIEELINNAVNTAMAPIVKAISEKTVSANEAAKMLNVCRSTIDNYVESGSLRPINLNVTRKKFWYSDVIRLKNGNS